MRSAVCMEFFWLAMTFPREHDEAFLLEVLEQVRVDRDR